METPKELTPSEKNSILFTLAMFTAKEDQYSFLHLFNYVLDVYAPNDYTSQAIKKVPQDMLVHLTNFQMQLSSKLMLPK